MVVQRSPKNTYEQFVKFEEQAADIYLRLATHFLPASRKLSAFWLEMAMEEKQHAGLLQFCVAEGWFAKAIPNEGEIRKFAELVRDAEKQASSPSLDKNAAFELAAELEGSEVNAIYSHLTSPVKASLYLLKRRRTAGPSDHIGHLAAAARKFGVSTEIVEKIERLRALCPETLL